MTTLTFYGGVGEIGGNKILLTDSKTRVFLDFGMNFEKEKRYYEPPYLQPRNEDHLLGLGILPPLKGLYKNDETEPSIDAVLLSHPHLDHYGYLKYLKDDIPIICGEATKTIIIAKELSGLSASGYQIANLTKSKGLEILKEFVTFRTNRPPSSPIVFNPVHVDHSVPGAYGLILETSRGNVVYTGDFRLHGPYYQMTEEFIAAAKESEPSALIIEGTNIVNAKISSEDEVKTKIIPVIEHTKGLAMAGFSINDIDRLRSFYEAAQATGRKLAISMKQAFLLHKLESDPHLSIFPLDDSNISIFVKEKKKLYLWEQEITNHYDNIIDASDVEKMQNELILTTSFYDMNELIAIKPISGSTYILSQSEPFNEEMEIDFEKMLNWLERFGVPQYHIHVSGHALPYQLKWAIEEINPEKVFLVHTEKPELYKRFLSDLNMAIVSPEEGKEYEV
ncbi:MAG: MBL fold metallo-hydrolase [Methanophagales archaeon]|nr:MBL fold metallo-hydrolase [Methanophagales archaeon]